MINQPSLEAVCTCLVATLAALAFWPRLRDLARQFPCRALGLFVLFCLADSFAFSKPPPGPGPGPGPTPEDQTNAVRSLTILLHRHPLEYIPTIWRTGALHPEVPVKKENP